MGLLARAGAVLSPRAEHASRHHGEYPVRLSKARNESVNTILEIAAHKKSDRQKSWWCAGCLVERSRDECRKRIPTWMPSSAPGLQNIMAATGIAPAPVIAHSSPFVVLNSRTEADARAAQGRFSRGQWDDQCRPAQLPVRRRDAAYSGDSKAHRLHQGRRRLRPPLYLLHHSAVAWTVSFASLRVGNLAEAERLAQMGVREITLIGQDTTCYGEDFGLKDGLALLLEKLAKIEDLRWIRFLYAYPNKITRKLLETIGSHEKSAPTWMCPCSTRRRAF